MKTETIERDVTTNVGSAIKMRIDEEDVGIVFGMLMKGIYSRKEESICREVWTNAFDAHVEAGCPERPFEITYPTLWNPEFSVRDYGPSMTHEEIEYLYSSLGKSTKRDSNAGVGKWGIGSKSPFAYTDTFTLTAFQGGRARYYTIVEEGEGEVSILLMSEEDTDEEDGILVSFPVQSEDIRAFNKAMHRVAYAFDVKPLVVGEGADDFAGWTDPPVLNEGEGWKLLRDQLEPGGAAYAKMGCVLYPIDVNAIDGLSDDEIGFLSGNLIIEFPIGALEITPSRETLDYGRKKPTQGAIRERIRGIVDALVQTLLAGYEECETFWEACQKYQQHLNIGLPGPVHALLQNNAKWQGKSLVTAMRLFTTKTPFHGLDICSVTGDKRNNRSWRFTKFFDSVTIHANHRTMVVIEDRTVPVKERVKRPSLRLRYHHEQMRNSEDERCVDHYIWVRLNKGREAANDMIALLEKVDGIEVVILDELPEPPKEYVERTRGARRPVEARIMSKYHHYGKRQFADRISLEAEDFDEGGYYVPLERMVPMSPAGMQGPWTIFQCLVKLGVLDADEQIIGAPKTLWSKFEGEQWVNIYDLASEHFNSNASQDRIQHVHHVKEILGDATLRNFIEEIDFDALSPESDAHAVKEFFDDLRNEDLSDASNYLALARALGRAEPDADAENPLVADAEFYKEIVAENYPLFEAVKSGLRWNDNKVDKLTGYVYMCDIANATIRQQETAAQAAA